MTNTTRKLASIQVIADIQDHPNADRLEIAQVKGWKVVVKKGEFYKGQTVIYFEIDSFIPNDVAPFLTTKEQPSTYKDEDGVTHIGERLKTKKLRGVVSQGLVLPLSILPDNSYEIGDDVTLLLDVVKWEPVVPAALSGLIKGNFPSFIPKTCQERVQNIEEAFFNEFTPEWIVEEKLDGSSCTVFFNESITGVCSRNLEIKQEDTNNSFVKYALLETRLNEVLPQLNKNIAVQGELCGPGIQGNKYKLDRIKLFVFDIFLIDEQRYALNSEKEEMLKQLQLLGAKLQRVPVIAMLNNTLSIEFCLEYAKGKSVLNNKQEREGLVFKSNAICNGQIVSFKSISNLFLLKHSDD